jgi:hypothetical protein
MELKFCRLESVRKGMKGTFSQGKLRLLVRVNGYMRLYVMGTATFI